MKTRFIKGRSKNVPAPVVAPPSAERKDGDVWMHPETSQLMRWTVEDSGGHWELAGSRDYAAYIHRQKYGKSATYAGDILFSQRELNDYRDPTLSCQGCLHCLGVTIYTLPETNTIDVRVNCTIFGDRSDQRCTRYEPTEYRRL